MNYDFSQLRKFVAPEFVFGCGARHLAGRYAKNFGADKVLVVTDPGVVSAGWTGHVLESLESSGIKYTVFSGVHPNPRDEEVMAGAQVFRSENCNVIMAVGGGSPMDCAKGIGIVSSNNRNILGFEGADMVDVPGPPLICVPTTSGSSADVSQFAIINDTKRRVKVAIISKTVVPDAALIDPETLSTMSPYLGACTGMDALTHAIEAYVSNAQSPVTDLNALEAIRLISSSFLNAVNDMSDKDALSKLMLGSMYAGLAFSNASLGLVHAMAHSLGGFLDHPHGECNAILLSHVIDYNFDAVPERYRDVGEAMGMDLSNLSADAVRGNLLEKINTLRNSAGITFTLSQRGVEERHIKELASKAIMDPCVVTNPKIPEQRDIEVIYEKAM